MHCLYASDYGPPDPNFDPFAGNGKLLKGFEAHVYELAQARNLGQLEAMERKLQRGEEIHWCEQGYGWVYEPRPTQFFEIVLVAVVLPYLVLRVFPRLRARLARWPVWRRGAATLRPPEVSS